MKNLICLCLIGCLVSSTTLAQRSAFVAPLTFTKTGYRIDLGEAVLDPVKAKSVKVDVALVDFSALSKAKTGVDSTRIIERIYKDPSKFSIVTGTLQYLSSSTADLLTNGKFKFSIADSRYTLVIVENNGKDNSGTSMAPQVFYRKGPNCRCKACGCCCYRTVRGCTYCGIKLSR